MMNTKGMLVNIYKSGDYDCTMNGVSSKVTSMVLIGEGVPEIFTPSEKSPLIYLSQGQTGDPIAVPRDVAIGDKWGMFGGNFLWSCDSRFRQGISQAPIRIHDRIEN